MNNFESYFYYPSYQAYVMAKWQQQRPLEDEKPKVFDPTIRRPHKDQPSTIVSVTEGSVATEEEDFDPVLTKKLQSQPSCYHQSFGAPDSEEPVEDCISPKSQDSFEEELKKTSLCIYYLNGQCHRKNCDFAHGEHELQPIKVTRKYKTMPCVIAKLNNNCQYNDKCRYKHEDENVEWRGNQVHVRKKHPFQNRYITVRVGYVDTLS